MKSNLVSLKGMRLQKEWADFIEELRDRILKSYDKYVLLLYTEDEIAYSHSDKEIELIAKFIQKKEECGVISVDDFLSKLQAKLKAGAAK